MTEVVVRLESPPASAPDRRDIVVATALFCLALVAYFTANARGGNLGRPLPLGLFVLLSGSYLALGVPDVARRLNETFANSVARIVAGPAVLWAACVVYAGGAGLPIGDCAGSYAIYLAIPSIILATGQAKPGQTPWRELAAAVSLGAGVKYHLLPSLPVPAPGGYDASRLVGLVAGLYFFVVARPLEGVGYRWSLTRRDAATAVLVFLVYAAVALPVGFGTHFITWNPRAVAPGAAASAAHHLPRDGRARRVSLPRPHSKSLITLARRSVRPRDCIGGLRTVASPGSAIRGAGDDCRRRLRVRVPSHGEADRRGNHARAGRRGLGDSVASMTL